MDFRKTFYILPNLFTLSSVLCGFAALTLTASGRSDDDLYLAALAICFGFFFDTFDGRVARLTKTQTDLGRDLDSLADVITFGAAPALLVYKWGLTSFGRLGVFVAGLFVCAGALRLARFNVLERRSELAKKADPAAHKPTGKPGKYTTGLSIPPAASVLVFMVIISHHVGDEYRMLSEGSTATLVLVLSLLMVSRVRFRSFKDVGFNRRTAGVLLLIAGAAGAIWASGLEKGFIFLVLVMAYIGLGLTEEVLFFRARRVEARAAKLELLTRNGAEAQAEQREEEAVLRELGAFDEDEGNGDDAPAGAELVTGRQSSSS